MSGPLVTLRPFDGFRIGEFVFGAPARFPRHEHAGPHLLLVTKGRFTDIAAGDTRTLTASEGLAYPGSVAHEAVIAAGASALAIQFDHGVTSEAARALDELRGPALLAAAGLAPQIVRLRAQLRSRSRSSSLLVASIVLQLAAEVMSDGLEDDGIAEAKAFIAAHLDARLEVRDVARAAGYSTSHFARLFRQRCATTVGAYVRAARGAAAARRLESTDEPIADIALGCGYSDQAHFTNAFRSTFGITPFAYRRGLRSERP